MNIIQIEDGFEIKDRVVVYTFKAPKLIVELTHPIFWVKSLHSIIMVYK